MAETKWPDSPWWIERDDRDGMEWNNHIAHKGGRICFMAIAKDERDNSELEAAAHLIAAAPALYEALEQAVKIIREHVPIDALGMDTDNPGAEPHIPACTWPILEEHLHYMDKALASARGESE